MKRYIIGVLLLLVAGTIVVLLPTKTNYTNTGMLDYAYTYDKDKDAEEILLPDDMTSIRDNEETVPLDTNPESITVLVNRKYLLPSTYIPAGLTEPNVRFSFAYSAEKRMLRQVAATALENMFRDALKKGIILAGVSGYRSYKRQEEIYNRNVMTRGVAATDAVSAKPGSSEHQTGLSIDISAPSVQYGLAQALGNTTEGKWIARNAHKYGFIIRYPKGKDDITGYSYEPWHIRYVGETTATYLHKHHLCLEEYYGETNSTGEQDRRVDVEDADKLSLNTATPRPKKTPTPAPKKLNTPAPTKKPKKKKKVEKTPKPVVKTPKPVESTAPEHSATPKPTAPPATDVPEDVE